MQRAAGDLEKNMLMCGCDWTDRPTVHAVKHVTARKHHKCCECGRTIEPGEVYERVFGVWDGVASYFKTCEACEDLRMSLEAMGFCPAYGYVREEHQEYIAEYDPPKLVRQSGDLEREMKACECIGWTILGPQDRGEHHHVNCPKYSTEKFPILFYYEDACDAWIPAPEHLENIIESDQLQDGEEIEIRFKRIDYTDAELAALPEE